MSDVQAALSCPACSKAGTAQPLSAETGLDGRGCDACGGIFLPLSGSERLLGELLARSRADLVDLADSFGGRRFTCPGCRAKMRCLVVRSTDVDLCFHCGGLWLEHGGLERLSGARYHGPTPKRVALPVAAPTAATELRLDGRSWWRRASGSLIRGGGYVALLFSLGLDVGGPPLVLSSVVAVVAGFWIRRRRTIDIFPRARRLLRSSAILPTSARDERAERFDDDAVVVVRPHFFGAQACLMDGCGRQIAVLSTGTGSHVRRDAERLAKKLGVVVLTHHALTLPAGVDDVAPRLPTWLGRGLLALHTRHEAPAFLAFELRRDGKVIGLLKNAVPRRGAADLDSIFALCFFIEVEGSAVLRFHDDGAGNIIVIDGDARQLGALRLGAWSTFAAAQSPLKSRSRPAVGGITFVDDVGATAANLHADRDDVVVTVVRDDEAGRMAGLHGLVIALALLLRQRRDEG